MSRPKTKAKLLESIRDGHRNLADVIASIPEEIALKTQTVGEWSVKDTIAHVTAWEQKLLGWYDDGLAGKPIDMPDWRVKGTLTKINRGIFEANQARSLEDILADFEATYRRVIAAIEAMPEEDIYAAGRYAWTGERKLLNYIWSNTVSHYGDHRKAIERMKK